MNKRTGYYKKKCSNNKKSSQKLNYENRLKKLHGSIGKRKLRISPQKEDYKDIDKKERKRQNQSTSLKDQKVKNSMNFKHQGSKEEEIVIQEIPQNEGT